MYIPEKKLKRKKIISTFKKIIYFIFFLSLVGGIIYLLFFSSIFTIKKFKFKDEKNLFLSEDFKIDLISNIKNQFGTNYFFYKTGKIMIKNQPLEIESLFFEKNILESSVIITVKKRVELFVYCENHTCAWLDNKSILFKSLPKPEGSLIFVINNKKNPTSKEKDYDLPLGEPLIKPEYFTNIKTIINSSIIKKFNFTNVTIDQEKYELEFTESNIPKLTFSYRFNNQNSLEALEEFLKTKDLKKINSINLTAENRLYYK